jgi:hypothetical protein
MGSFFTNSFGADGKKCSLIRLQIPPVAPGEAGAVIESHVVLIQHCVTAQGQLTVNSQPVRHACIISGGFGKTVGLMRTYASMAIHVYAAFVRKFIKTRLF